MQAAASSTHSNNLRPTVAPSRRTAVPHYRGAALRLPRHPDAPDPSDLTAVRRWVRRAKRPRAIDLFCGAGGLSLGLRDAGFSVLLGADCDAYAVETHTANIGGLGFVGDLTDPTELLEHLDGWGINEVELVAGGVPCQPFSRAGHAKLRELVHSGVRTHLDPRAGLWRSFMAVVERLRPRAVLVENVPDLPLWDDGAVLSAFLESLGELGYLVDARILECFRYGVPQRRTRLVLVALADGVTFDWPEPTDELTSLHDAIGDLPPVPGGQRAERLPYRPRGHRPLTAFQARMRAGVLPEDSEVVHDHITRAVRPDDLEAFSLLAAGQTYADMPEHLRRYRSDIFTDKYKRLSWSELSRTITAHIAKDGYWYIHPEQHRTLSVREAARLQTFPDWFRFAGQPSHRFAQIGNAVPPQVGEAVGQALRKTLAVPRRRSSQPTNDAHADLLSWYESRQTSHPWRRSGADPWHVLLGELCLDRASAEELLDRFPRVLAVAPSPCALVDAGDDGVAELRGAGLSASAAGRLVAAAAGIDEVFDGEIPDDDLELRLLPGVGDHVARAVICFGFDRPAVLLDAVTARVAGRVHGREDRRRWQLRLDLHGLAGASGPDASFNTALLELGNAICRLTRPHCRSCPWMERCATGRATVNTPKRMSEAA